MRYARLSAQGDGAGYPSCRAEEGDLVVIAETGRSEIFIEELLELM
jgi:hypothetical protein